MQIIQSRRDFLAGVSLAAAAGILRAQGSLADEAPGSLPTLAAAARDDQASGAPQP
jgi:hypothetical protein